MTDEEQSREQSSSEQEGGLLDKLTEVAQTAKGAVVSTIETLAETAVDVKDAVADFTHKAVEKVRGSDEQEQPDQTAGDSQAAVAEPVVAQASETAQQASPAETTPASGVVESEAPALVTTSTPEVTSEAELPTEAAGLALERSVGATQPAQSAETETAEPAVVGEAETGATLETAEPAVVGEAETGATLETAEPAVVGEAEAGAVYEPAEEDDSGKPRRIKDLEVGMELEGRVTSTALYGIFVDIGVGRDGLVHISEMSDRRIESPTEIVQIGDLVTVRIKSVDPESRRISLTMRSPRTEQPGGKRRKRQEVDTERLAQLKPGDLVDGTISGLAPFGVFVDIGVGKDGLVHISELSSKRVEKAEDAVSVGETHTFRILEVDPEGTRISLSLRRASEDFQDRQRGGGKRRERDVNLEGVEPGKVLDGTISGLAPFGAFVDIGVGRDGLVHISELGEGRVAKVEDAVKVGDKVQVRVLGVDPDTKRISLSLLLEPREDRAPRMDRGPELGEQRPLRAAASPERYAGAGQQDRGDRGRGRRGRNEERPPREPELYVFGEEEEAPVDNATLDDLLSKYGGAGNRKNKGRREKEDFDQDDEEFEAEYLRRQRDVIRRTLGQGESE